MFEVVENWALHAFADGELEAEERKAMERLLSENEDARKALAAINYQKSELRKAYSAVLDELVPLSLIATAQGRSGRGYLPYAAMAASVALLLVGGTAGWFSARQSGTENTDIAQRALVAHEVYTGEQRHAVEVAANEREHLQAWLSKRVGTPFVVPNLEAAGYPLLGGRLLAAENSPAGQIMYEKADKKRLTIFVSANTSGKDQDVKWSWSDKLVTCYWREGKLALAVTGEMSKDEMTALAKNIYEQMDIKS